MFEDSDMPTWELIASDRNGAHDPIRYNGIPAATRAEAYVEAWQRYGKETGLDSDQIKVREA